MHAWMVTLFLGLAIALPTYKKTDNIACPIVRALAQRGLASNTLRETKSSSTGLFVDKDDLLKMISDDLDFKSLPMNSSTGSPSAQDKIFKGTVNSQTTGNIYLAQNRAYCLTNRNGAASSGNKIHLGQCLGSPGQQWTFEASDKDNSVKVLFEGNRDYCLNLHNNAKYHGATVNLWQCNGHESQKWSFGKDPAGNPTIRKWGTDFCLNLHNNAVTNDGITNIWGCNGHASQRWVNTGSIDLLNLHANLDHSASTGIIGSATSETYDALAFNLVNFNLFKGHATPRVGFTAAQLGAAVNDFGKKWKDNKATKLGPFSWGILGVEHANTFATFATTPPGSAEPVLSLSQVEALWQKKAMPVKPYGMSWVDDRATSMPPSLASVIKSMGIKIDESTFDEMNKAKDGCPAKGMVSSNPYIPSHDTTKCCPPKTPSCVDFCGACMLYGLLQSVCEEINPLSGLTGLTKPFAWCRA